MDKLFFQPELPFLSWLEEYRISQELMAFAYDEIGAQCRGALKTAIALTSFIHGHNNIQTEKKIIAGHAGFWQYSTSKPVNWALVVIAGNYKAAARLCAAAVMPILANVQHIYCIWENGPEFPLLLPVLELCGLEEIFCLKKADIIRLMANLHELEPQNGRMLLLHEGSLTDIAQKSREYNIYCFEEAAKPRLLIRDTAQFNLDILEYAQGFMPEEIEQGIYDAVYASSEQVKQSRYNLENIPLVLTPGLECFWKHHMLSTDFFLLETNNYALL